MPAPAFLIAPTPAGIALSMTLPRGHRLTWSGVLVMRHELARLALPSAPWATSPDGCICWVRERDLWRLRVRLLLLALIHCRRQRVRRT